MDSRYRWPGLRKARLVVLAAFTLPCCVTPTSDIARPGDLPERVLFRGATESFNREWYVALRDGRIWIKPNPESGQFEGDWELLGETGMPQGCGVSRFGPPDRVAEISADGIHLMALSSDGVFYRGTNMTQDARSWFEWSDSWGWPAAMGEGLTVEWTTERGWDVADSHPLDVGHYEDRNGTSHSTGLGVAHIYRLGPDGRRIYYNDWWLPNDWSRQICGPERGTFTAANLSASASTIFLIGERGEMYTRLYDFDTSGESDLLMYSFIIDEAEGNTRALPAEGWRRQPDIDAPITSRIAIFQTGEGNAARTLRVEGEQDGAAGFYFKQIYAEAWSFEETGHEINDPHLDPEASVADLEPDDRFLSGRLEREGTDAQLEIEIEDFNLFCSPSRAYLLHEGQRLSVDGAPLELTFHHVHSMVSERRPTHYFEVGMDAVIRAALVIPDQLTSIDDDEARRVVAELIGTREVINLVGTASEGDVELEEIPNFTPSRVPWHEKGWPGSLFRLRAD